MYPDRLESNARVFAALGDPTRLNLVHRLRSEPDQSASRLSADLAITRQAVGKHLGVMEASGIVSSVKSGRERLYSLRREALREAEAHLRIVTGQWETALQRLKTSVERDAR